MKARIWFGFLAWALASSNSTRADAEAGKLKGAPDHSPLFNALLGRELTGRPLDAASMTVGLTEDERQKKQMEQRTTLARFAFDSAVGKRAANVDVSNQERQMRLAEELHDAIAKEMQAHVLVPANLLRGANKEEAKMKAFAQPSALAEEAFVAARAEVEQEVLIRVRKDNEETVTALLTTQLAKAGKATLQDWAQRQATSSATVLNEVIAKTELRTQALDHVTGKASEQLRAQMAMQLGNALGKALKPGQGELEKLQQQVDSGLDRLKKTASVVNALEAPQQLLDDATAMLNAYDGSVDVFTTLGVAAVASINAGADQLPAEKRAALKAAVSLGTQLLRGEPVGSAQLMAAVNKAGLADKVPDKKKLAEDVKKLSRMERAATFAKGVSQVQEYVALAQSVGLLKDPKVNRVLGKAQTAASVVAAYYSGNFVGAVGGAASLFGAGPGGAPQVPDPQIMAKLERIIELQQQTLQKLDQLQQQLAKATEAILTKLDGIDDSVTYLLALEKLDKIDRPLNWCLSFTINARADMTDGAFASYKARADHYNKYWEEYRDCDKFLRENAMLLLGGPTLPATLWNVQETYQQRRQKGDRQSIFRYDRETYFPMVAYTMHALGLAKLSDDVNMQFTYSEPCATSFIGALALAPYSAHDVEYGQSRCSPEAGLKRVAREKKGQLLGPGPLLDVPVNSTLVAELAYYTLLLNQYRPLVDPTAADRRLLSEEQVTAMLAANGLPKPTESEKRLTGMLDVVNVALAQQTLLSGIYVSKWAADQLVNARFGTKTSETALTKEEINKNGCAPHKMFDKKEKSSYEVTVCLMARHPAFARNVMQHLVLRDLSAQYVSLQDYESNFDEGGAGAPAVLGSLPKLQPAMRWREGAWELLLQSKSMGDVFFPLPPAGSLKAGTIAYPEPAEQLRLARTSLLEDLQSTTAEQAEGWTRAAFRPRGAFLPRPPRAIQQ